jgi:hypothetical protein
VVRLGKNESALVRSLERDSLLVERVERLMTIPAVGPITALTWALEIGDVQRFSSIKKAINYCGLCGAEKSSGNTVQRTPLSKQRNKHLQTTLIEAAKMARATVRNWPCSMTGKNIYKAGAGVNSALQTDLSLKLNSAVCCRQVNHLDQTVRHRVSSIFVLPQKSNS